MGSRTEVANGIVSHRALVRVNWIWCLYDWDKWKSYLILISNKDFKFGEELYHYNRKPRSHWILRPEPNHRSKSIHRPRNFWMKGKAVCLQKDSATFPEVDIMNLPPLHSQNKLLLFTRVICIGIKDIFKLSVNIGYWHRHQPLWPQPR